MSRHDFSDFIFYNIRISWCFKMKTLIRWAMNAVQKPYTWTSFGWHRPRQNGQNRACFVGLESLQCLRVFSLWILGGLCRMCWRKTFVSKPLRTDITLDCPKTLYVDEFWMASTLAKRSRACMFCRPTITSMFASLLSMDSRGVVSHVLAKNLCLQTLENRHHS